MKFLHVASVTNKVADLLRPQGCEVSNSVGVSKELSWLTEGMANVK
jgi:hypothetical protein